MGMRLMAKAKGGKGCLLIRSLVRIIYFFCKVTWPKAGEIKRQSLKILHPFFFF
jgi:hypothetical protein